MAANELFSSLISDIRSYNGKDPLLPWLSGIKKLKETLPSNVLKEKLPRFLQKCSLTFMSDRRYRNDLRYLRVWLQLMDYVDEPRSLLRTMEMNQIGIKQSLFYQAYALYYEKMKKFEEAEKMYHLGVQNLAEPIDELKKSYEQFLCRMERHKNKNIQRRGGRTGNRPLSARQTEENNEKANSIEDRPKKTQDRSSQNVEPTNIGVLKSSSNKGQSGDLNMVKEHGRKIGPKDMSKRQGEMEKQLYEPKMFCGDDTVVVKFVDTAIVGKSEAEDACHHGLVDPTIHMKEAMNAINSMFREPLETAHLSRRPNRSQAKDEHSLNNFSVFVDGNLDDPSRCPRQKEEKVTSTSLMQHGKAQSCLPQQEPFQIFIDDEESREKHESDRNDNLERTEVQSLAECLGSSASSLNAAFVFPRPKDLSAENSEDTDAESSSLGPKLREDTVVRKFVGSTIQDEPVVENVCHHGLVEPTVNLKEAMDDINNMFGKPIDFVRSKRSKNRDHYPSQKQNLGGFSILPDDDSEHKQGHPVGKSSGTKDADLFEPTVFTKEAMDDINKMFGMPLDF